VTEILEDAAEFRIPEEFVKEIKEYREMTKDLVAHLVAERGRLMEENRKMEQTLQEIKRVPETEGGGPKARVPTEDRQDDQKH